MLMDVLSGWEDKESLLSSTFRGIIFVVDKNFWRKVEP